MSAILDAVVIGAGQAGLAAAYHLKHAGLRFVVLEAAQRLGGSWSDYYDSLKLFSPARYSALPGLAWRGDLNRYPLRDEVIAYLNEYAERFELPVKPATRVRNVHRDMDHFRIHTVDELTYQARTLIAATGSFHAPNLPSLPGQDRYQGQVLHAASYRQQRPFAGKRIVVVGAGNSAVQIAAELAQVANVTLATRRPVRFAPQRLLGCDLHCWLHWTGLDHLSCLKDQSTPVLDTGVYRAALKSNRPDQRPLFLRFSETGVMWNESEHEAVDVVLFATGYRPSMPYLAELPGFSTHGRFHRKGISVQTPGLYFVGLSGQRSFRSATLRGVGGDARYVVRALKRYLLHG